MAALTRYHRKGLPRPDHPELAALTATELTAGDGVVGNIACGRCTGPQPPPDGKGYQMQDRFK